MISDRFFNKLYPVGDPLRDGFVSSKFCLDCLCAIREMDEQVRVIAHENDVPYDVALEFVFSCLFADSDYTFASCVVLDKAICYARH